MLNAMERNEIFEKQFTSLEIMKWQNVGEMVDSMIVKL